MEWLGGAALVVVIGALASIVVHTLRVGIAPMPSSSRAVEAVLQLVPSQTTGEVLELGAGFGTLVFALARHAPGATVVACESSPLPFAVMWVRQKLSRGAANVRLHFGDFATVPLGEAKVVVCYLWPGAMTLLGARFEAELTPGALIVSNTFGLRGWAAEREITLSDVYRTRVYRYVR